MQTFVNVKAGGIYRVSQEERSIFWEVIVSVILSKEVYMYVCPIPNGFRDRATSLYSSKTVDKKQILRLSLSLVLRPTVSRPVCLGIKNPAGA
jgi:hypothetical protein